MSSAVIGTEPVRETGLLKRRARKGWRKTDERKNSTAQKQTEIFSCYAVPFPSRTYSNLPQMRRRNRTVVRRRGDELYFLRSQAV